MNFIEHHRFDCFIQCEFCHWSNHSFTSLMLLLIEVATHRVTYKCILVVFREYNVIGCFILVIFFVGLIKSFLHPHGQTILSNVLLILVATFRVICKCILIAVSNILFCIFSPNRAVIGEIDDDADNGLDFNNIKAEPLNSVSHWTSASHLNWFIAVALKFEHWNFCHQEIYSHHSFISSS